MTTPTGGSVSALSRAELHAARLDGDVFELGGGFLPADAAETPRWRADTLAALYGSRFAAVGLSAAWVHGATEAAPTLHLAQPVAGRRPHVRIAGLRVRDRLLSGDETIRIGSLAVLTPACTLADLALALSASAQASPRRRLASRLGPDDRLRGAIRVLAADPPALDGAREWLARRVTSNKIGALALLNRARPGQEDVTR